jgi:NAD(P)-dependent dehydrogenase (short-subunit alcohol dehydrogenase family)
VKTRGDAIRSTEPACEGSRAGTLVEPITGPRGSSKAEDRGTGRSAGGTVGNDVRLPGFDGRVAVVTGAARGIGRGIAEALAAQGAHVALLDVSWEGVDPAGVHGLAIECDISEARAVDEAIAGVEDRLGYPSILVNNAAILRLSGLLETSDDEWDQVLAVNLTGAFLCTQRVVPGMRAAGYGRILNIGSNSGKMGGTKAGTAYAVSKAALHNLSRSVAIEFAAEGITANTIAACLIETEMATDAGLEVLAQRIPVGRMGSVDDVAYAALFLTSSAASYVTAEIMDVNGGYYID